LQQGNNGVSDTLEKERPVFGAKYFSVKKLLDHYGLKKPLDWEEVFGNGYPVEVEIGCGLGEFLNRTAAGCLEKNFVGIEIEWKRLVKTMRKLEAARLSNARLFKLDAAVVFERLIAPRSLAMVYCLFPCPWPKKKHAKNRLFSTKFLRLVNSRLSKGGELQVVTDYQPYVEWIKEASRNTGFKTSTRLIKPRFDTKFEKKWVSAGQNEFFEIIFTKQRHINVPLKEDVELKRFAIKDFVPERFSMEDEKGAVTLIFKDIVFDARRQKAMVQVLVAEENLSQYAWINVEKGADRWRIYLSPGQSLFPTMGINRAIETVYRSAQKTMRD